MDLLTLFRKRVKAAELPKMANPRVVAEKLLAEVLPPEAYLELAATGYCDIPGKRHKRYRLYRNVKTEIEKQDGSWWSSCIHLTDSQAPDTDRIVAEYLLITQDEAEYLKTANLTQIRPPEKAVRGPVHCASQNIRPEIPVRLWDSRLFTPGLAMATGTALVSTGYFAVSSCGISLSDAVWSGGGNAMWIEP